MEDEAVEGTSQSRGRECSVLESTLRRKLALPTSQPYQPQFRVGALEGSKGRGVFTLKRRKYVLLSSCVRMELSCAELANSTASTLQLASPRLPAWASAQPTLRGQGPAKARVRVTRTSSLSVSLSEGDPARLTHLSTRKMRAPRAQLRAWAAALASTGMLAPVPAPCTGAASSLTLPALTLQSCVPRLADRTSAHAGT